VTVTLGGVTVPVTVTLACCVTVAVTVTLLTGALPALALGPGALLSDLVSP
jgi:hypothetical protein